MAIEYYESINDRKFLGYKQRQNELLVKPEVIKNMNKLNIPEKARKTIFKRPDKVFESPTRAARTSKLGNPSKSVITRKKKDVRIIPN